MHEEMSDALDSEKRSDDGQYLRVFFFKYIIGSYNVLKLARNDSKSERIQENNPLLDEKMLSMAISPHSTFQLTREECRRLHFHSQSSLQSRLIANPAHIK